MKPAPDSKQGGPDIGDNRLPELATTIREAHNGVLGAAKTAAERAIEAGTALIEAKKLVKHGQWLRWLRDHCRLPERTAQLYMQIAASGLESATVAALGLKGAADAIVVHLPPIDYYADCQEHKRDWFLFGLYLVEFWGWYVEGSEYHLEWLLRNGWHHPDEWLGDEGDAHRRSHWNMPNPSAEFKSRWRDFLSDNAHRTIDEITEQFAQIAKVQGKMPPPPPSKRRRRRASENGGTM